MCSGRGQSRHVWATTWAWSRKKRGALYYVATLAWVGCVADTSEVATWFGDDIAFRSDSYQVDFAGLPMLGFMLRHVGTGSPAIQRLRLAANLIVTGGKGIERGPDVALPDYGADG